MKNILLLFVIEIVCGFTSFGSGTNDLRLSISTNNITISQKYYSASNIISVLRKVEIAKPPEKLDDLKWFEGKWKCIGRIFTEKASFVSHYAYIDVLTISQEMITPVTDSSGGYVIGVECYFKPPYQGLNESIVSVVYNMKGFWFEAPHGDPFIMKKERGKHPNIFILEHQMSGDVLIFKRVCVKHDLS